MDFVKTVVNSRKITTNNRINPTSVLGCGFFYFHEHDPVGVHTILKEGSRVGIERTDLWLDEYFHQPSQLIKEHIVSPEKEDAHKLYHYLRSFGMYSPNESAKEILAQLKEQDYWSESNKILNQYRNDGMVLMFLFIFFQFIQRLNKRCEESLLKIRCFCFFLL